MTCRAYERWIEDEASGLIAPGIEIRLHEHLRSCGACQRYRERTVSLAHLLARTRAQVPMVDVRERVMDAIHAGVPPAVARKRFGRRALWQATAASLFLFLVFGVLGSLSALLFSARSVSSGSATWRTLKGLGATLWSLLGAAGSLVMSLLDAAAQAAVSLAPMLPFLEVAALTILVLTVCSAALPLAREFRSGVRPQRSEIR
ncbi:MAG: hypothetical protein O7F16_04275 [Acidobacteria bacterium]|nr:hypothetical protein [Acidobacteriota bacterium]